MNIGKKAKFEQSRNYDDMGGNVKTFTIRDYTKKTKVAMPQDKINYDEFFIEYRKELVERLLDVEAYLGLPDYERFINNTTSGYEWDLHSVKDSGVDINELRRMTVHCENKQLYNKLTY